MSESEIWKQELEELKALRARLKSVDEAEELDESSADIREYLKDEIDYIDKELKELEEKAKEKSKKFEEYYNKLKETIEESEKQLEETKLLSNEEIYELRYSRDTQILRINAESVEALREYKECKKTISLLRRRKNEINDRIKMSEALGLTYNEYKEIVATLRKTSIVNKIYAEKGLESIALKKASERTKEEQELLNKTKEEIITEINAYRREKEEYSVRKSINALYYPKNTKVSQVKESKEEILPQEDLKNLALSMKEFPQKIKDSTIGIPSNAVEEAPKDMENSKENEKVDINDLKPAAEKVTVFKDNETEDYYVRQYAIDRFKLTSAEYENEVRINGSKCYKISENDVKRIKEGANNSFSPYIADVKEVSKEDIQIPFKSESTEEITEVVDTPVEVKSELTEKEIKEVVDDTFEEEITGPVEIIQEPPKDEITEVVDDTFDEEITGPVEIIQEPPKDEITEVVDDAFDEEIIGPVEIIQEPPKDEITDVVDATEVISDVLDMEPKEAIKDNLTKEELIDKKIIDAVNAALYSEEKETEDINGIVADELENEETPKKDINDMLTEEIHEIEDNTDLGNIIAINIQANEEFKKELSEGETSYNIVTTIPKLAKRIIAKIKSFFEPVYEFDGPEETIEEQPKQR